MKLEEKVVKKLSEKNLVLACAESCTGGLISKRITDVSGSSAVFNCGVVSYSNEIKEKVNIVGLIKNKLFDLKKILLF